MSEWRADEAALRVAIAGARARPGGLTAGMPPGRLRSRP